MKAKKPTSFKVLILVASLMATALVIACFFSYYRVDPKYAMLLPLILFPAFAFTMVGIYTGIKYKATDTRLKRLNLTGLIGNLAIFLFIFSIMVVAALSNTTS